MNDGSVKVNSSLCREHGEALADLKARVKTMEDNVASIWRKLDRFTVILLVTMGGVIANLVLLVIQMAMASAQRGG